MTAPHSFLGLRTAAYATTDLAAARAWYTEVVGHAPYFDQPFYVGFNLGGYELGLNPDLSDAAPGAGGVVAYWGVADIIAAVSRFESAGATIKVRPHEVGEGIKVATVADPFGNLIGLIENPHFKLP